MNHEPDDSQIYTYDDLPMTFHDGWLGLQCPVCGPLTTPRREPTLSDFTNAAIEHLELHGAVAA